MHIFILSVIVCYLFIILLYKTINKNVISDINIFDLIVILIISEMTTSLISGYLKLNNFLLYSTIVIMLYTASKHFYKKNSKLNNILNKKTNFIIKNGIINFKLMDERKYSLNNLLMEIRNKGVKSLDEVEYAILESNGRLSIFLYDKKNVYPYPLIIDGIIQYETLNSIDKNKLWLMKILKKENTSLENVFYAFYKNNKCFIIKKK